MATKKPNVLDEQRPMTPEEIAQDDACAARADAMCDRVRDDEIGDDATGFEEIDDDDEWDFDGPDEADPHYRASREILDARQAHRHAIYLRNHQRRTDPSASTYPTEWIWPAYIPAGGITLLHGGRARQWMAQHLSQIVMPESFSRPWKAHQSVPPYRSHQIDLTGGMDLPSSAINRFRHKHPECRCILLLGAAHLQSQRELMERIAINAEKGDISIVLDGQPDLTGPYVAQYQIGEDSPTSETITIHTVRTVWNPAPPDTKVLLKRFRPVPMPENK